MYKAFINPTGCLSCVECFSANTCPAHAIFRIDAEESSIVEIKFCRGCGDCIAKCPQQAIILKNH